MKNNAKKSSAIKKIALKYAAVLAMALAFAHQGFAAEDWKSMMNEAKGGEVFFYGWGGSVKVNAYLEWVAMKMKENYDIRMKHVKLDDTATAVSQTLADKTAGNVDKGLIDLIWINGENFRAMKSQGLLHGPFAGSLPNSKYLDLKGNPAFASDFNTPTEGYESPLGLSKMVFVYEPKTMKNPPRNLEELKRYAAKNPGRITYPRPPDFTGSSFLKQLLYETNSSAPLTREPTREEFDRHTKKLWAALEEMTPNLWNEGKAYPKNESELRQLFNDGEIDLYFTFAPLSVSVDVSNGDLPEDSTIFVPEIGSLANAHFVAIPFNSPRKAAAKLVANFLLSPEAQLKKQSLEFWGDFSVLDETKLNAADRKAFIDLAKKSGGPTPKELGIALPEPHPAWMEMIETGWSSKFTR